MRPNSITKWIIIEILTALIINTLVVNALPSIIDQIINEIDKEFFSTMNRVFNLILKIMRVAYIVVGAIGVLLWALNIETYRGKKLIIGAIITAIVVEYLSRIQLTP